MKRPPAIVRFNQKFKIDPDSGCWIAHRVGVEGYGGMDYEGKTIVLHRVSWMINVGEIPDGLFALHTCDNRACCNYKHLYLGTKKQNRQDFMNRHPKARQLIDASRKLAVVAVKNFWDSMTPEKRKEFCKNRRQIQNQKRRERERLNT